MTATMWRRGAATAGVAVLALSGLGTSGPAGATEFAMLEDCFGAPLLVDFAIFVPENSTGWTNGTSGNDVIIGTDGPDLIDGMGGDDHICAGKGADGVLGDEGADMIKGEGGADTIYGMDDNDFILGDAGADTIYGGDDDDFLAGERGEDELYGEDGADGLSDYGSASGVDQLDCGGDDLDTAIFDEDIDEVSACDILVEYSGPTEDGD